MFKLQNLKPMSDTFITVEEHDGEIVIHAEKPGVPGIYYVLRIGKDGYIQLGKNLPKDLGFVLDRVGAVCFI